MSSVDLKQWIQAQSLLFIQEKRGEFSKKNIKAHLIAQYPRKNDEVVPEDKIRQLINR